MRAWLSPAAPPAAPLLWLGLALALAAPGCGRDRGGGLPPAKDWKPPVAVPSQVLGGGGGGTAPESAGAESSSDSQLPPGHPPVASGSQGGDNPHAGGAGGGSSVDPGLSAPDPNRPIDPKKFLSGKIRTTSATADSVKPGAVLFLSARPVDPATGTVLGQPLAAARTTVTALPMPFRLDETNMMLAGTRFEGDVVISAWVDSDGDARTHQAGDVHGEVRAHIPQGDLDLVLDTIKQ